jgi:transcriptional regulator with XRE-family HTH domain
MQIYENVRSIRAMISCKQETVAKKMGISQNAYSRLERGKVKMTIEKKKALSEALGISEETIEFFHERKVFFTQKQQYGAHESLCPQPSLKDQLEGFRSAVATLQSDNNYLRQENKELRELLELLQK